MARNTSHEKFAVLIAGTRAATLLGALLSSQQIPSAHVSHAREIMAEFDAAFAQWTAPTTDKVSA